MANRLSSPSSDIPDWMTGRGAWVVGPSWLLSAIFHLAFAFLVWQVAQSPGCQPVRGEQVIGPDREVGIFVREAGDRTGGEPGASPPTPQPGAADPTNLVTAKAPGVVNGVPDLPFELPKPNAGKSAIGIGPTPAFATKAAQGAGGPLVSSRAPPGKGDFGTGPGNRSGQGSGSGTSMFGIPAKGRSFAYVIDRSASMADVLPAAKGELLGSIQRLDEQQSFVIVFFNDHTSVMSKAAGRPFHGTEADRLAVRERLVGVTHSGGTQRLAAFREALQFKPEVIYYLTDSEEPKMTAADLEQIRLLSRGETQIHCVEFGIDPQVRSADGRPLKNFLHKLAEQSGGRYEYREIGKLSQP